MKIGNDIVDLHSSHSMATVSNNRWSEKVFSNNERNNIQQSEDQHIAFWKTWTMKEACYKVISKMGAPSFFNFHKIKADITSNLCNFEDHQFTTQSFFEENYLHTITVPQQQEVQQVMRITPTQNFTTPWITAEIKKDLGISCRIERDSFGIPFSANPHSDISFSHDEGFSSFYFSMHK